MNELRYVAYKAMKFARFVHKEQKRKYTNRPYFEHLAEVAGIVASVEHAEIMIAVAYLHDTMEDQGITYEKLCEEFGIFVAEGVLNLSNLEKGKNRAERKAKELERLTSAPPWVQTIRCADLISNTYSIVTYDPGFARTYLEEKRVQLDAMTKADPLLRSIGYEQVNI